LKHHRFRIDSDWMVYKNSDTKRLIGPIEFAYINTDFALFVGFVSLNN